jgi:chromosome partitioning protein
MIVSIASQKGGTGKTTTSISVAAALARRGRKVLLVDVDSQANSSKVLLPKYQALGKDETVHVTIIGRKPLVIHQTEVEGLDVVPSHILLSNTDVELSAARLDRPETRLKRELDKVASKYNDIIIDCPPALSWLTINAFTASNRVLIVVSPGYFELDSIVQISDTLMQIRDNFNPDLRLAGFLFTMSDATIASKQSLQVLRQTYTDTVFRTIIPKNTAVKEAHFKKKDIFSYDASSAAANAYSKLVAEMFQV